MNAPVDLTTDDLSEICLQATREVRREFRIARARLYLRADTFAYRLEFETNETVER